MRQIDVKQIIDLIEKLCIEACYTLPDDILKGLGAAAVEEASPLGRETLEKLMENCRIAVEDNVPVCQDTGMAVIFVELGQFVALTGGDYTEAIHEGVRRGYRMLRASVVADPLRRENTGDNTPAVIHTEIVPGEEVRIILMPKGFGSENMSAACMFPPSATAEDVLGFIVESVAKAGSNPCPPVIIGVGLGGTLDSAAVAAKKALLRPVGEFSGDAFYADLEREGLRRVNALGIGPQGFGGSITALSLAISPLPTHIAGMPCVIAIGCHAARRACGTVTFDK